MRSYYEDRTKMNTVFWARIGWFSFLRNVSYLFWGAWFSTYSHQDSNRVHLLLNIHLSVYKEVEPTFYGQIAIWLTTTLACFHLFSLFNHHSGRLQELNHVKSKCLQLETVQTQSHHPFSHGCSCKKSHGFFPHGAIFPSEAMDNGSKSCWRLRCGRWWRSTSSEGDRSMWWIVA